jgi:hypothetical protein
MDIPTKSKIYFEKPMEVSDGSAYVIYDHPDGMYSYCKTEKGGLLHLSQVTPLETFKDGYKISAHKAHV